MIRKTNVTSLNSNNQLVFVMNIQWVLSAMQELSIQFFNSCFKGITNETSIWIYHNKKYLNYEIYVLIYVINFQLGLNASVPG
jgi:hypothetical protein